MLGGLILASQITLSQILGVQLVMFLMATVTVAYRTRALIPIYIYNLLYCFVYGFYPLNMVYFYIYLPLWGLFMLAGGICERLKLPLKARAPIYMIVCGLFGLSFGTLYAPFWAMIAGLSFEQTLVWIAFGFPTDIGYAVSNVTAGVMIVPLSELLKKLDRS
jgi:hypothetical protein